MYRGLKKTLMKIPGQKTLGHIADPTTNPKN